MRGKGTMYLNQISAHQAQDQENHLSDPMALSSLQTQSQPLMSRYLVQVHCQRIARADIQSPRGRGHILQRVTAL
jgi:hypothetical protein